MSRTSEELSGNKSRSLLARAGSAGTSVAEDGRPRPYLRAIDVVVREQDSGHIIASRLKKSYY